MTLMQLGYWDQAADIYGDLIRKYAQNEIEPPPREAILWIEEWAKCNRELNRWQELYEWAESSDIDEIKVEALWKMTDPNWTQIKEIIDHGKLRFQNKIDYFILKAFIGIKYPLLNIQFKFNLFKDYKKMTMLCQTVPYKVLYRNASRNGGNCLNSMSCQK